MGIGDETKEFGIVALSQNAVAQSQEGIANIDGKSVAIEGIDGGLTIARGILILHIIVDE